MPSVSVVTASACASLKCWDLDPRPDSGRLARLRTLSPFLHATRQPESWVTLDTPQEDLTGGDTSTDSQKSGLKVCLALLGCGAHLLAPPPSLVIDSGVSSTSHQNAEGSFSGQ